MYNIIYKSYKFICVVKYETVSVCSYEVNIVSITFLVCTQLLKYYCELFVEKKRKRKKANFCLH